MTNSHEISFLANNIRIDAEYRQHSKNGHLTVFIDCREVVSLGWMDYQADYFTDHGLEQLTRSELAQAAEFNRDPSNFGEGEKADAELEALFQKAGF